MFERLQKKWKVNGLQLALIISTFAIGGSLTGYAGRKLLNFLGMEKSALWVILYIILITILWPAAVLLVSIPFGQFRFFIKYLKKIGRRMGLVKKDDRTPMTDDRLETLAAGHPSSVIGHPSRIAVFASGAGSNAQKIIDHFKENPAVNIALIVCNNPAAGVLSIGSKENIPSLLIEKEKFFRGDAYFKELKEYKIDFIVLAGFLWKIPVSLIKEYAGKIINIHPALLPKYGGKGMYGNKVHEAVIAAGDKESGITVHYVDEIYDHGKIILQEKCTVLSTDTPEALAKKIHALEHQHYPVLIEQWIKQKREEHG
ncbi:MAG: phosphoribosylglycinamide formyltransferase [Chitinophagaceae bacterium]